MKIGAELDGSKLVVEYAERPARGLQRARRGIRKQRDSVQ